MYIAFEWHLKHPGSLMDQSKMIDKTRQKLAGVTTRTTFVCVCYTWAANGHEGSGPDYPRQEHKKLESNEVGKRQCKEAAVCWAANIS